MVESSELRAVAFGVIAGYADESQHSARHRQRHANFLGRREYQADIPLCQWQRESSGLELFWFEPTAPPIVPRRMKASSTTHPPW